MNVLGAKIVLICLQGQITFDKKGWCNACQWMEKKKNLISNSRIKEFEKFNQKF